MHGPVILYHASASHDDMTIIFTAFAVAVNSWTLLLFLYVNISLGEQTL